MKRKSPSFIEISTAEATSIQLELTALSRAANDSKYEVGYDRVEGSGVARFVEALVQSFGGGPLEPPSIKKNGLFWLPGAPLTAGGPSVLHNLHNPLLRHWSREW